MSDCSSKYREYPQPAPASPAPRRHWGVLIASLVIAIAGIAVGGYGLFIGGRQGETQDALETALTDVQADLAAAQAELTAARESHAELQASYVTANAALTATKAALKQLSALVVRDEIISELTAAMSAHNVPVTVDPQSGDIVIASSCLTFESVQAELTIQDGYFLHLFVPVYLDVLLRSDYAAYIDSITIESHTVAAGSPEDNMELSTQRATEVQRYILQDMYSADTTFLTRANQLLTAVGKGDTEPIKTPYGGISYVDSAASNRLVFKFTLTGTDLLPEINKLLNGQ